MPVLFETQYHPPITFFAELLRTDVLWLEAHEHYRKQTYRNRCLILTAHGVKSLIVPVVAGNRSEKVVITDLEIDYRQPWVHQHWRTLQTAYGSTPYFEYYADYLHDIYQLKLPRLFDLNQALLHFYCRCLRLRLPIECTTAYRPAPLPEENSPLHHFIISPLLDRRDWLTPKDQPPAPDRKSALPYSQTFGVQFVPNLSILDLLFMQGPAAGTFLT